MCKHNYEQYLSRRPRFRYFLLSFAEYRTVSSFSGKKPTTDDVRAAEVRVDAAEQGHLMTQPHAQYAIARFCFNAKHARGPQVAGREGPPVVGRERGGVAIQELAVPPFRPIYPEAEEVAVREARPPPPELGDQKMLQPRDSVILHLSEPLVKNRESQSCLSMG